MEYWPRRCLPKATIVLQEFLLDNWQRRCWHYFLHTCSSPSQLLHYTLYQSVDSFKCTSLTCRDLPQVMQSISWEKKLRSFILRHIVTAQGDFPLPISQDKTNGSQRWECQTDNWKYDGRQRKPDSFCSYVELIRLNISHGVDFGSCHISLFFGVI